MPWRELVRQLERGFSECVEQPEAGGSADRGGQAPRCFPDGIVADGGDSFEIGLEAFDEWA